MRKLTSLLLLALLALLTIGAAPAGAQASTRCFAETGYCIGGPILRYWEQRGGLAVFGYPITEQRVETVEGRTIPVQWFERDRLEIQADGTITAGRLGARTLELQGRRWEAQPRSEPFGPDIGGCTYFPETGRGLCEPFLSYWRASGAVERFGYPISGPILEQIEGSTYSVQYFERRRIEQHPELAGTPYEFLYGLLGRELLELQGLPACQGAPRDVQFGLEPRLSDIAFRPEIVCPTASYAVVAASSQQFEGGNMIWVDLREAGRWIYVYRTPRAAGQSPTWAVYPDTYSEGEPPIADVPPPDPPRSPIRRSTPQRGFGKVWAAGERSQLGWAIFSEQPDRANVQLFAVGGPVIQLASGRIWVFGPQLDHAQWLQ
jgi:hypothetical protein